MASQADPSTQLQTSVSKINLAVNVTVTLEAKPSQVDMRFGCVTADPNMSRAKAEAAKANEVSVISRAELDRIKNITKIMTKEEQEMQRTVFQEQKNQSMAASKARIQRIKENDFKRATDKDNIKARETVKKEKVETLLTKAMDKLDEDDDDVKVMNQNVLQARVLDIRGKQLAENQQLERDWINEQAKLDRMMELERLKELKIMEEKAEHRKVVVYQGCSKIIDQIKEREVERLRQEEIVEKERMQMLKNIELAKEAELKLMLEKKERIKRLQQEAETSNKAAITAKEESRRREKALEAEIVAF